MKMMMNTATDAHGTPIDQLSLEEIDAENRRRNALDNNRQTYNPMLGLGCVGPRVKITDPASGEDVWVPEDMVRDPLYSTALETDQREMLRHRHDFEYWAAQCVNIRHKLTGQTIRMVLNAPQRTLLAELERQRREGKPIRVILLKARQWGGSTLVQMYMAWMQCCRREQWHSLICANVCDISSTIRGMFSTLLNGYPRQWWQSPEPPKLKPFEGSVNIRVIPGRNCRIATASAYRPDCARGMDHSMAHLSEVAYWQATPTVQPEMVVQSVCGGVPMAPDTVVVMESTANGVGNFFHQSWLRAKSGESAFTPLFIPWYEIEMYRTEVRDLAYLVKSLTTYERKLWLKGLTLEQILWYHRKRMEIGSDERMQAEYPTTDLEAFNSTVRVVFDADSIEQLRHNCCQPTMRGEVTGNAAKGPEALTGIRFQPASNGALAVWERPTATRLHHRYVTAVDVGGRSESSDWSVIAVFERLDDQGQLLPHPRLVAQWRGHTYHDLLAWKAAAIARWYGNALLVVESNSLETEESDSGMILELIAQNYRNTYVRRSLDTLTLTESTRVGFHTNRATKAMIIDHLLALVRDAGYIERDELALNEMMAYEKKHNGAYGARPGCHDDILMTRAIGLYVASTLPKPAFTPDDQPYFLPRL